MGAHGALSGHRRERQAEPIGERGLLIVNADDWGLRTEVTDAILKVHRAGQVTSATALVHMPDSARAAALAGEHRLAVGLHLNFTYPYGDAPSAARERQAKLIGYFTKPLTRMVFDPRMSALVSDCLDDQLEAFGSLYGGPPAHVDGHHHIHACPTVAFSPALAGVPRIRPLRLDGQRYGARRLITVAETGLLRRRFRIPRGLHSLGAVHPELGGVPGRMTAAVREPVEIMTHPHRAAEQQALLSGVWSAMLTGYRTGSYADL